ncbi:MAG: hypothetical protein LBM77_10480 [Spirochaetaceae bacterium]|jgi:hypothetical protein|nr:hypothetical protein [Spirochaetaceae bacterium]
MIDDLSTTEERRQVNYWHPAFRAALRLELEQYADALEIREEVPLNTEPLRIDALVIRKIQDVELKKNLATIFRKDNIVEFKGPSDYLSVDDFYKVYAYACLYSAITKGVTIKDVTITMIESSPPQALFTHLKKERKYDIIEKYPGIYYVEGDYLPIQIIATKELEEHENLWLSGIRANLGVEQGGLIARAFMARPKENDIETYFDIIMGANPEILTEVQKMKMSPAFREAFARTELGIEWHKENLDRAHQEDARRALALGLPVETVREITGLTTAAIQEMAKQ